jgi:phospholipid/cholesterol/gamma-HCH transport system ATP-binding protein
MSRSGVSKPSSPPDAAGRKRNGPATPVIELRSVYKRFGRLEVLRGIDLKLHAGQTTVVIGESGTGKSVLLKHIVGLLRPDAGEVFFKGTRVDGLGERKFTEIRRKFGFLFQGGALFDSMTASENVGFPLAEHTRKGHDEIAAIVAEKLRMVGLEGIGPKKPAELSGGQRKRVALARAIALDPEVILYDEPTTGLDPVRADVINELIVKLKRELNVTGVVVTHDMTSAYKVADRIVMLYEGEFIADGTPDEIRKADDERVQRFIEGRAGEDELRALHGE